ncbi:purine phosphoribosyltransferase [Cystobacter fuscus]|uniref:phosphoribosyltransferase n=1 Tax=Cystobacter fuscus TaxID=43 RepID=UPI002B31CFB6|nr:purine phosphoribosyltransferase [Cystobacter fuscus]
MEKKSKLQLSWGEIDQLVELMARQIKGKQIDVVLGISRAGLVPAVMLSHHLGVRDFAVMDIKRTDSDSVNATKSAPVLRGILNESMLQGRNVLLVDDIVGEGLTMRTARELLSPKCKSLVTCVLVVNQKNLGTAAPRDVVDHHGCLIHGWITFPWEGKL